MSSDPKEFTPQSLFLRVQKKMASKFLTKSTIKMFSDKISYRIIDNIGHLILVYTKSKSTTDKVIKFIITLCAKLNILESNNVLNAHELKIAEEMSEILSKISQCFVNLNDRKSTNTSINILLNYLAELKSDVEILSERHLKEKSRKKIEYCALILMNEHFFESVIGGTHPYKDYTEDLCSDLQYLLDRQLL